MSNKGVVFTLTVFLLMFSAIMISVVFMRSGRELHAIGESSWIGEKTAFMFESTVYNPSEAFLGVTSIGMRRLNASFNVTLQGGTLSPAIDHPALIEDYRGYVTGAFASVNNVNISYNITPELLIQPYNVTYGFNKSKAYLLQQNASTIQGLVIFLRINQSHASLVQNSSPSDNGAVPVIIHITGIDRTEMLTYTTASLSPLSTNDPFHVAFNNSAELNVTFGRVSDHLGTLLISISGMELNITSVTIALRSTNDTVLVSHGAMSVTLPSHRFTKRAPVVLARS